MNDNFQVIDCRLVCSKSHYLWSAKRMNNNSVWSTLVVKLSTTLRVIWMDIVRTDAYLLDGLNQHV